MKHAQTKERFLKFWNREKTDRPTITFCGIPYVAKRLARTRKLLQEYSGPMSPEMIVPEEFLESYEENLALWESLPGDSYFTAEPINGFPWAEAMAGCGVMASAEGFTAHPCAGSLDELKNLSLDTASPWVDKYFRFLEYLGSVFKNRCPVGQPLFRGIADLLAALAGPEKLVYALYDAPGEMHKIIERVIQFYISLYKEQMRIIPPFEGGSQIGVYDVWTPGPCLYLQDDNLVLFSGEMYEEFFKVFIEEVTKLSPYNVIHVHPVSFRHIDMLAGIPTLGVIEANHELDGVSLIKRIEILRKIQKHKRLIIQGPLTQQDLRDALAHLDYAGLHIKITGMDAVTAPAMFDVLLEASGNRQGRAITG
jgi:hypothetical protein